MSDGNRSKRSRQREAARQRAARSQRLYAIAGVALLAILVVGVAIGVAALLRGDDTAETTTAASSQGASLGDANAPVTVIEFADFQCPVCRLASSAVVSRLEEEFIAAGKVRLEFRHFPILGQESWWAAQAAECAKEQGKFWEYHDKLFNSQSGENKGVFAVANLKRFATETGLETASFGACLDNERQRDKVEEQFQEARGRGLNGTPTFVVGDKTVAGADWPKLRSLVEQELAKAQ